MDEHIDLPSHLGFLTAIDWQVVEIDGRPVLPGSGPNLSFSDEGRLAGSSGLNRLMGSWSLQNDRLSIPALASTKMGGEPEAMDQETRLLEILTGDMGVEIILRSPHGTVRLVPSSAGSESPK